MKFKIIATNDISQVFKDLHDNTFTGKILEDDKTIEIFKSFYDKGKQNIEWKTLLKQLK